MTEESKKETLKMLQNEKTPVVHSEEMKIGTTHPNPAIQSSEANAKKSKKKKKKGPPPGRDNQQKEMKSATEETAKQESTELTPDEQLCRELDWCIEQLELGLKTQKTSSKQREEATRALKTLCSSKAPLVKKRQVMRAVSGDYRKKMEEERAKQFKLIQSTVTSAQVSAVSDFKPVFIRRAEKNTPSTDKTGQSQETQTSQDAQETNGRTATAEESQEETKPFVFTKTQEDFCFNFTL